MQNDLPALFCSKRDYIRTNMTAVLDDIGEEPVLFAVVREPIERFLSGFLDKCILWVVIFKD
ncbi:hypothetical protein ANCCAN_29211 [Ancylostoma caninum]|uniref:Sulfotransferase domain-containing protein n=1 Tax=Ancylostoma caninum TaxID=29170 RepID=A0A368F233_ANCCA|nr:hypothetical protein ANCCAN_29211 [Ancylostoma caninum]